MGSYWGYAPYVSVAERRAQALLQMEKLRKKGLVVEPVRVEGIKIAQTFWGKSWCQHLESFSDFASRLPRGRTYVRNGSVCHMAVEKGKITAKVSGSELYDISIEVKPLPGPKWNELKSHCAGRIGTLLELLQGRLSGEVMKVVTDQNNGLFPLPKEISMDCSCPDFATMCKHVAAVLYGVGARLDQKPELLFLLRGVDHAELAVDNAKAMVSAKESKGGRRMEESRIGDVFGIEVARTPPQPPVLVAQKPEKKKAHSIEKARPAKAKAKKKTVKR
jgi:uncharacterized Zn finger protein